MDRLVISFLLLAGVAVLSMVASAAADAPDLVVTINDITVVKDTDNNETVVTVIVHNNGDHFAGSFTFAVGVSKENNAEGTHFDIPGLAAGMATARVHRQPGLDWTCGWGNADIHKTVAESNESNNSATKNVIDDVIDPDGTYHRALGIVNPGPDTETIDFTVEVPPEWTGEVTPDQVTLTPFGFTTVYLVVQAPLQSGPGDVIVRGAYLDGTPGTMDWMIHLDSPVPTENTTWGQIKSLYEAP